MKRTTFLYPGGHPQRRLEARTGRHAVRCPPLLSPFSALSFRPARKGKPPSDFVFDLVLHRMGFFPPYGFPRPFSEACIERDPRASPLSSPPSLFRHPRAWTDYLPSVFFPVPPFFRSFLLSLFLPSPPALFTSLPPSYQAGAAVPCTLFDWQSLFGFDTYSFLLLMDRWQLRFSLRLARHLSVFFSHTSAEAKLPLPPPQVSFFPVFLGHSTFMKSFPSHQKSGMYHYSSIAFFPPVLLLSNSCRFSPIVERVKKADSLPALCMCRS